ncbi:hypothetical protein [Bradyrhizobium elkanii]|uniref:hypothetical protein n=1 Tax=Bradyrhizobium elkanii TaxID=29448 RepID=UPI00222790D5|nr:hypothetical protein [Bradyrhizobium elkanii]
MDRLQRIKELLDQQVKIELELKSLSRTSHPRVGSVRYPEAKAPHEGRNRPTRKAYRH